MAFFIISQASAQWVTLTNGSHAQTNAELERSSLLDFRRRRPHRDRMRERRFPHTERFRITVENRRQRTDVKAGNAVFHGDYFGACVNDTDTKTFCGKQTRQVSDESRFSAAGARRYHGIFFIRLPSVIYRAPSSAQPKKCVSHAIIERRNIFYAQNLSLIGNGAAANPDLRCPPSRGINPSRMREA